MNARFSGKGGVSRGGTAGWTRRESGRSWKKARTVVATISQSEEMILSRAHRRKVFARSQKRGCTDEPLCGNSSAASVRRRPGWMF